MHVGVCKCLCVLEGVRETSPIQATVNLSHPTMESKKDCMAYQLPSLTWLLTLLIQDLYQISLVLDLIECLSLLHVLPSFSPILPQGPLSFPNYVHKKSISCSSTSIHVSSLLFALTVEKNWHACVVMFWARFDTNFLCPREQDVEISSLYDCLCWLLRSLCF